MRNRNRAQQVVVAELLPLLLLRWVEPVKAVGLWGWVSLARNRLNLSVGVRHEVAVAFVTTKEVRDVTRYSATGILPKRAWLVMAGCEAFGTM